MKAITCWFGSIVIAGACITQPAHGQRQRPTAGTPPAIQILEVAGRPSPASQQVPAGPARLAPAQQLALARSAASRVTITGIGSSLRLTPAEPAAVGRAGLAVKRALSVDAGTNGGGHIVLQQDEGGGSVEVTFRPTMVGRPILVDFAVSVTPPAGAPVAVHFGGETRHLNSGQQHVTALVVPSDLGWHTVSLVLPVPKPAKYVRLIVYSVELTTMQ
jgi:hypothetical protein